jgi:hypothetical protein
MKDAIPKIFGRHWTFSRPPGCHWRYRHEHVVDLHGPVNVWQLLGWQLAIWRCQHGS